MPFKVTLTGCLFTVAMLTAKSAAEESPIALPQGQKLSVIEFDRHVVPLLSRFGCNSGSCHGSFQGRGGLRMSLFGHSPQMDYEALVERIDDTEAGESLVLQKPIGQLEHEGGVRFEKDSWTYHVVRRWIEQGAERGDELDLVELTVEPRVIRFDSDAEPVSIRVSALFAADDREDVTPFCRFTSGDEGIVTVDDDGLVSSQRSGASHITIEYRGQFVTVLTSAPLTRDLTTADNAETTENNFVDQHIHRKLRELNITPSETAGDLEFLRRATIDAIGRLPTEAEIEEFLAAAGSDRRAKKIDQLLHDRRHAALWATRFCDITRCTTDLMEGPDELKAKRARMWHDWFRTRLENNVPYDQIVRGVLCGTSRGDASVDAWIDREAKLTRSAREGFNFDYADREFLDLFWRRITSEGEFPRKELAEVVSAGFMGVQIECAGCHKHPYDRWTQADYNGFINVFSRVTYGSSTELNRAFLKRMQQRREDIADGKSSPPLPRLQEIYNSQLLSRPLVDDNGQAFVPQPLGGTQMLQSTDPREQLMGWLVADGKQQFARNFVNRVWAHYFGRGIVEPVDGFSAINPPTHPELLSRLAQEFIDTGYDIRRLERTLMMSQTYQRSSTFDGNNDQDDRHFARSYVRPLLAEVAIDTLHQAIGLTLPTDKDLPPGSTAIELASDRPTNSRTARLMRTFGREQRKSACDCDRQHAPSLQQSLFLMSDAKLMKSIDEGQLLADLLATDEPTSATKKAFLRCFSRYPTSDELATTVNHLESAESIRDAWRDVIWALLSAREFRTNH